MSYIQFINYSKSSWIWITNVISYHHCFSNSLLSIKIIDYTLPIHFLVTSTDKACSTIDLSPVGTFLKFVLDRQMYWRRSQDPSTGSDSVGHFSTFRKQIPYSFWAFGCASCTLQKTCRRNTQCEKWHEIVVNQLNVMFYGKYVFS